MSQCMLIVWQHLETLEVSQDTSRIVLKCPDTRNVSSQFRITPEVSEYRSLFILQTLHIDARHSQQKIFVVSLRCCTDCCDTICSMRSSITCHYGLLDCLTIMGLDRTYRAHHSIFSFTFLIFVYFVWSTTRMELSWLPIRFLLHVKYTLSYRIVCRFASGHPFMQVPLPETAFQSTFVASPHLQSLEDI